jgi:mannosyltransferase OCH1-like enzyme
VQPASLLGPQASRLHGIAKQALAPMVTAGKFMHAMSDALLIPRVFHQIWLGNSSLPQRFERWADLWVSMNPGWRMQWWTDRHLPEMTNRQHFDQADRMAAKSDILRYEICSRYGGVYVDADFEPLRPIEPILADVSSFQADELDDRPCNAIIGCVPNDPFYRSVVEAIPESIRLGGDIVETTGPGLLKRVIGNYLGEGRQRVDDPAPGVQGRRWRVESADRQRQLHGFHWSVFYPYHYDQSELENQPFPDAFGKHHWTASWWKNGGV